MPRAIRARKKKGLLRGPFLFAALLGGLESNGRISRSRTGLSTTGVGAGDLALDAHHIASLTP